VLRVADTLPKDERARPAVRLAVAFAAVRSGANERAIGDLDGLTLLLPALAPEIAKVLALAQQSKNDVVPAEAPVFAVKTAFEESADGKPPVVLSRSARLAQLKQSAERGQVEVVDAEVSALLDGSVASLTKSEGFYLRGKARLVARREQREGAKYLTVAADQGYAKPSQLRLDAARLYVREGDAEAATKLYVRVALSDRARADEALYYAARTQATLGEPKLAAGYYAEVLRRFPRSRYADEARYERALNGFSMGRYDVALGWLRGLLEDPQAQAYRPMIRELSCVVTLRGGHVAKAVDCFRAVVSDYPLHLAGLFARARLSEQSISVEPRAMPATPTPRVLGDDVSLRIKTLVDWGLDELAAQALENELVSPTSPVQRERKWQCRNYGAIGYGGKGYAISSDLRERVQLTDEATAANRWAFDCRFPTFYSTLVQEFETKYQLPTELVFAVMRQESGFRPEIASNANAYGLLQLLPETAQRVASELAQVPVTAENGGGPGSSNLSEPRVNLELGAAYLRKLLVYFEGNLVLAVAAYNAGPRAVGRWANHGRGIPMELFVARIPYAETRNYVDRVLSNLAMYRYLRQGDAGLPVLSLNLPKELTLSETLY
jgi:soluble lytic murein transglycosylase